MLFDHFNDTKLSSGFVKPVLNAILIDPLDSNHSIGKPVIQIIYGVLYKQGTDAGSHSALCGGKCC